MTDEHEHDSVWVTNPDNTQARLYCRSCGARGAWGDLPPELRATHTADGTPIEEATD